MICTDFYILTDDYCDGELSAELEASCEAHLASCPECARAVANQKSLLAGLKAMPVPGPSEGFAKRALRIAAESEVARQSVDHHRGFMVGFGSAATAALALWVVMGVQTPQIPGDTDTVEVAKVEMTTNTNDEKISIPEFSIALNERRDIKLAFYSSEDLKGAKITLQMPENVALVGYEGRSKLVWKTNLAKGDNTLRLPIVAISRATGVATSATGGQMVAHIEYKGRIKTLKVNLTVNSPEELSSRVGLESEVG